MRSLGFVMACVLLAAPAHAQFRVATLRGGGTTDFWVFNLDTQLWETLPSVPAPVGSGGALAQLQRIGMLYALRGDGTHDFWQFKTSVAPPGYHWEALPATPGPVGDGGGLVGINYGSDDPTLRLYALQGGGSTVLWKYDVASSTWSSVADVPEPVGAGGAITAPNRYFVPDGNRGFIDVLPGNGSSTVWSYNFATAVWTRIDAAPAPVHAGGALANLPYSCDFAFVGGGSARFFLSGLLCIGAGERAPAPAPVGAGAGIAPAKGVGGADPNLVYAARGGGTPDFWRFRVSTNDWEVLPPAPHSIATGGAVVQVSYAQGIPIATVPRSWGSAKSLFR